MTDLLPPTWTILVPTIGQRAALFRRLLDRLLPQLDEHEGRVRVLAWHNAGQPSLGVIRDGLMAAAGTDYVSFIDDDDLVPIDFVAVCVEALATRPDTLGFQVSYSVDGEFKEICDQSLKHRRWHRNSAGVLCRDITHVAPIKTSIATRGRFAAARPGKAEDRVWVKQVRPFTQTEVYLGRVMYEYLYYPANSSWGEPSKIESGHTRAVVDHPYFRWHEGVSR